MIRIIMSHWASYLFLGWVATIVVANLWLRKRPVGKPKAMRFSPPPVARLSSLEPFQGEPELSHRDR